MSDTLEKLAEIISETSGIDPEQVQLDKHVFDDLMVDSLDFLDITFDIDQTFKITMPIEDWMAEVEQNRSAGERLFTVKNIVNFINQAQQGA